MDAKKVGVVCITAILATEVLKHEEGNPHTHVEFEQTMYSRMTQSIYGIPNQQVNNSKTIVGFTTMVEPYFLK